MPLQQLYSAYLGELYGIAFFTAFAQKYSNDSHINKWQHLIQVEQITANRLKNGLEAANYPCPSQDDEMENKGLEDAEKWLGLDWPTLIDTMIPWVEPYALRYREQAAAATEHKELFELVQAHEDAIYEFLLAEQHENDSGLAILADFIAAYAPTSPSSAQCTPHSTKTQPEK
ncbi:hypothetical protein ABT56_00720 [Photobacterium aquae]|uniref:Uncharacterized protein n=1 Tax=Photobacterium aquae TaxID=1195763 RepID=A0A0J1HDC0_9GAMM|nr:hypothetical protein [Photobacterium aquae]KLV09635.1 hypothetical protein ABT56_00720 [Photobacterium aquae]